MEQTQILLRLNKSDYEQLKRQTKKNQQNVTQTIRELIQGKQCFCQHQNIFGHVNTNDADDEKLVIATKTFELVYESLLLLRDFTAITNPELTDLATEKRLAYFEEVEES